MSKNIIELNSINTKIIQEKLDIAVICFGGCCSNTFIDALEKNGYVVRSPTWAQILCHCPSPIKLDIPVIYLYRDPQEALLSMKRRGKGFWDINQHKLSNSINVNYSDGNLFRLMISQFYAWTNFKENKILILKYEELFEDSINNKLSIFLNNDKLTNFPIKYNKPNITHSIIDSIDIKLKNLFQKYQTDIDYINNFSNTLDK